MHEKRITLDFETRSACDLKKAGAYKYSLDPSTQPTCMAWKLRGDAEATLISFHSINRQWAEFPRPWRRVWEEFIAGGYLFVAHNAFFEQCIYRNILVGRYGWPDIPLEQWRCTAAKAAACALPRNLEGAGAAMKLTTQKDKAGFIAMMATCKPTKAYNAYHKKIERLGYDWERLGPIPPMFLEPEAAPDVWDTLYRYCKIDVETEELLDQALPDLNLAEQEIWFLNQKLNWRGLRVDIPTVRKIVAMMEVESKTKLKELDSLTMGLITKPGARQSILDFLKQEGIELPDIRAKTVEDTLQKKGLSDDAKKLLEIRKALSKTSTKKYQAFIERSGNDNRVRDILLYHGASTGRDTGTGIQPHNFPRGLIQISKERPYAAVQNVIECDAETLKLLYGENLSILFSSLLRNMILPTQGSELFVADFSKIEVAVLWWLAGNKPGLDILKAGLDPYKYMAAANTGKRYEDITDEGDSRQLGKAQVLGCGFGMGWTKFQTTAFDSYRLKLSDEESKKAVQSYREKNKAVHELWSKYELAAIAAIENKAKVSVGKCKFFVEKDFLWVQLPSKRKLAYREPTIAWRVREYEVDKHHPVTGEKIRVKQYSEPKKTVEFLGLAPGKKTMQTERTWGGTLTENIVQAVARDLMMRAIVKLERAGYQALLTVHDEAITERKTGEGDLSGFRDIMCSLPKWADSDLPLDAKAWKGPRYRK